MYAVFKPLDGKIPVGKRAADSGNMADILYEYTRIIFLTDIRNYVKFKQKINKYRKELHALYRAVGETDLAVCVLSFRASLPFYCVPEFHSERAVEFTGLYHPLIANPVPNTGRLGNDSIITGSNASGKSTFIKALAVNGILAQTIYTCAAEKFTARPVLTVTSMALRDNLGGGESYFIVEIKSLKRILDLMKRYPCACYIDEILRGTNNVERIAASAAVLEYIHNQNRGRVSPGYNQSCDRGNESPRYGQGSGFNLSGRENEPTGYTDQESLCVVASHDIELTGLLAGKLDNYHFREQVTEDGISFDYKLRAGAAATTNALRLPEHLHFDREITEKARELAEGFIRDRVWLAANADK
jgi:DNA mismatch repair ATPase MutS